MSLWVVSGNALLKKTRDFAGRLREGSIFFLASIPQACRRAFVPGNGVRVFERRLV